MGLRKDMNLLLDQLKVLDMHVMEARQQARKANDRLDGQRELIRQQRAHINRLESEVRKSAPQPQPKPVLWKGESIQTLTTPHLLNIIEGGFGTAAQRLAINGELLRRRSVDYSKPCANPAFHHAHRARVSKLLGDLQRELGL